jgi:sugar lactone lactonase YvrE
MRLNFHLRPIRILCIFLPFIFLPFICATVRADDAADEFGLMYWTHRSEGVYRAARDGSDVKLLVPAKNADGLAVDQANGKLYFLISNTPDKLDTLQRANLDGTQVEQIVGDLNWTGDLALDGKRGKLYVTSLGDNRIIEFDLDGTGRRDVVAGLNAPDELAVDSEHGWVYWGSSGGGGIQRVDVDGSQAKLILATQTAVFGLALDSEGEQLYWVDSPNGTIRRVDLDGKNNTQILGARIGVDSIALDLDNRKLYWTETGKIGQANLDGSFIETLVLGKTAQYASLVVLPPRE